MTFIFLPNYETASNPIPKYAPSNLAGKIAPLLLLQGEYPNEPPNPHYLEFCRPDGPTPSSGPMAPSNIK